MTKKIFLSLDRDGWTKGFQLNIEVKDKDGGGHGYRLAGPKYNGSSTSIFQHKLTERDATEIRRYLDLAFPQSPDAARSGASS